MDIYSFLNSRDIAAYCREINKVWNTYQMALIIGRSFCPIAKKHAAWRELIAKYPDMPTPFDGFDSLHKLLKDAIDYEERLIPLIKEPEQGAEFEYTAWRDNDYSSSDFSFRSFEEALANAKDNKEYNETPGITIKKIFKDSNLSLFPEISVDYDGNPYEICVSGGDNAVWFSDIYTYMDINRILTREISRHVDIPLPFKRGDILAIQPENITDPDKPEQAAIFVLESIIVDKNSFMGAFVYYVNENGLLYNDSVYSYDCVEYYRGELHGIHRLLQYVSWYLKDEIVLPALLTMQCRVLTQHQQEGNFNLENRNWYFPFEHIIAKGQAVHEEYQLLNKTQIEFLAREMSVTIDSVYKMVKENDKRLSGECMGIICQEVEWSENDDPRCNYERLNMAEDILKYLD